MKKKVILSTYCRILSCVTLLALCGIFIWQLLTPNVGWHIWVLLGVIVFLGLTALLYAPVSVTLNDSSLTLRTPLRSTSIPIDQIASVKMCPPTMTEKRIIGSGGFFGYYGIFSEPTIGRYRAFYGKASDCFLLTLTDGTRYLISCADAPTLVTALTSRFPH